MVVPVCAAIEAEIAQLEEADRADFLKRAEAGRARSQSRDPRRLCLAGAANLSSRPASKRCAPGLFARGRPRRRRPASSIPTLNMASSAPKSSPTTTSLLDKGEAGAKEAGKLRLEGKEYIVREGDVMHFRFNV